MRLPSMKVQGALWALLWVAACDGGHFIPCAGSEFTRGLGMRGINFGYFYMTLTASEPLPPPPGAHSAAA